MQKTIGVLAVLLAAQLMLALTMKFTGPDLTSVHPDTPLLDLGEWKVDRVTIEDSGNSKLVLSREGERWVLPDSGEFPADQAKVDLLLNKLKGLKRGLAVATSNSALQRFKVNQDAFERRLVLGQGDESLATLYFGTSPGLRRVHARTMKDDAVYVVEFSNHDASVQQEDWQDKTLLQISATDIESVRLGDVMLRRSRVTESTAVEGGDKQISEQGHWTVDALAEGETVEQDKVRALVEKLAGLRFAAVLGAEPKADYGLEEPDLTFALQHEDGQEIRYQLGKRDGENDYVLKVSSQPYLFRLPAYTGDALLETASREQLVSMVAESAVAQQVPSVSVDDQAADNPATSAQSTASERGAP